MGNLWDELSDTHNYQAERHLALLTLLTKTTGKVLDIGCGHGFLVHYLNMKGFNCFAIDISFQNLVKVKDKNSEINCCVCDATNLCFKENSFEIITSTDLLEHVSDQPKMIQEISLVMDKTGEILLTFPSYLFVIYKKLKLFKPHQPIDKPPSPKNYQNILEQNQLVIDAFITTGKPQNIFFELIILKLKSVILTINIIKKFKNKLKGSIKYRKDINHFAFNENRVQKKYVPKKYSNLKHILCGNVAFRLNQKSNISIEDL